MARSAPTQEPPMSNVSCFTYGVGQHNEGVCLALTLGPYRLLLDCGLADISPLLEQDAPDLVICSHAHGDHAYGLAALAQAFPQVPIIASEATQSLLPLNWLDLPRPQSHFCQSLPWRSPTQMLPGLVVELIPAGHLPGAALALIEYQAPERTYRILYTGDYCLSHLQLVEGLALQGLRDLRPDVLILEGQYGTRRLPHRRQQEKQFLQAIETALAQGKNILLPAPPLGLAQEILKLLRTHHQFTGRKLNLWAAGNVIAYCNAYPDIQGSLPETVRNFIQHQPLFWDDKVYPHLRPLDSTHWPQPNGLPHIVVTDRWPAVWPDPESLAGQWTLFLPQLVTLKPDWDWQRLIQLPQFTCDDYLLADHSDGRNTTQLIHNLRPQHLIFVHGQPADIQDLTSLEELQSRYQLHSPATGCLVHLPIGDRFVQPSPPTPTTYEGEIHDLDSGDRLGNREITIHLEGRISQDSRWPKLAETGILEARWQGDELILRGITQRDLIKQHQQSKGLENLDCCLNCRYFHNQYCWNQASPLVGRQVRADGYCPVYEA
ncbi:MAG: MBL fold metallo-hydrolase [Synechocystis sp.]|nr:MBL fold metallo-hydrolase [Synechocystis sp.]